METQIYRVTFTESDGKLVVEGYFSDVAFAAHLIIVNNMRNEEDVLCKDDFNFEAIIINY